MFMWLVEPNWKIVGALSFYYNFLVKCILVMFPLPQTPPGSFLPPYPANMMFFLKATRTTTTKKIKANEKPIRQK